MAHDSTRRKIVLFGGAAGSQRLGDTWELDGAGWAQPNAATAPTARAHAAMVFDAARGKVALFGATTAAQIHSPIPGSGMGRSGRHGRRTGAAGPGRASRR